MQKDWFPFFSMLFWVATKLVGLQQAIQAIFAVPAWWSMSGFQFVSLLFSVLLPAIVALVLLATETIFDLATSEMRGRQAVAK